ncbi:MAG: hypothetical protein ABL888_06350 [Pirellulaceae bacterium]
MALPQTAREQALISRNPHAHSVVMSYLGIRRSLGMLAFLLPVVLGPFGYLVLGIPIQENMSSYYHTPLRDVFVGVMCAMGIFLYCYHGYDTLENWTGNLACASAICVALFPLEPNSDPLHQSTIRGYVHTLSGGVFFSTLALYSTYHFPRGHFGLRLKTRDEQRDGIYFASGLTILGCMFLMGVYLFLLPQSPRDWLTNWKFLFWMEWIAVWAFSAAWLVKGQALLADSEGMTE